jgi:two-component system sensor histidine kinase EvgS
MKLTLMLATALLSLLPLASAAEKVQEAARLTLRGSHLETHLKVQLNEEDWKWLRQKGHLTLGTSSPDHRPLDITTSGENYEGVTADYASLLMQMLDIPITVKLYENREQARKALINGSIDLLDSANNFDVQDDRLTLTKSYAPEQSGLYSRLNERRVFPHTLDGVKIAVPADYLTPAIIREYFPHALIDTYNSRHEALAALAFGNADLYLGDSYSANLLINEQYFNFITIERLINIPSGGTSFAVHKDNQTLKNIIDTALNSIDTHHSREILRRWGGGTGSLTTQPLDVTPSESNWIRRHPIVRVAVSVDQAPIAFVDKDGNFSGVMSDILKIASLRTGLKFEAKSYNEGRELSDALKNNTADLAALTPSLTREATMRFSVPFVVMPFSLVTREDNNEIINLASLKGRRVAISKGHIIHERLLELDPQIKIIETKNFIESLEHVYNDKADVSIAPLNIARYYLIHAKDLKLKISGIIDPDKALLSFTMSRADTELESILNKVLHDIPPDELNVISTRWRANSSSRDFSWLDYQTLILQIAATVGLLILAAFIWNLYLRRQVSQRKIAERALSDQLRFMRTLIDGTPLPIYVRDRQGKLLICNHSYTSVLGVDEKDTVGKTAVEEGRAKIEDAHSFHADYMQAIQTGTSITKDRVLRFDNQVLHIYHWIQPYRDWRGNVQGVICGWLDISDRHQLINDLQSAKNQADEASRAKTTFLATMSHEIRTPMSAVIGMLELALKKRATEGTFDQAAIEVAYNSARGLLELIGDILDIVRIESGRLNLAPRRTNLRELAEAVIRVFDGLARQKGLTLTLDFDFELGTPTEVLVDPVRIKQILSNLISNAIKFTDKGQIRLRIKGTPLPNERIQLTILVTDTGIGISQHDQARLFKPFAQASQADNDTRGGTGLGLTICRSLCEMMGGTLDLSSEPGVGTQITLDLTLSSLPVTERVTVIEPTESRQTGQHLNVLIVDDHPANLMLLSQQLEFLGHRVTKAIDGSEALARWHSQTFDLIITDCNMPGMSGYELAEKIRHDELQRELNPCFIFGYTANAQPEEQERCLKAGMNKCLFKPISLEELTECTSLVMPIHALQPQQPEPSLTSEPFNLKATYQLTQGDKTLTLQLLAELIRSNRGDIAELLRLTEAFDLMGVASMAHKIRGAARIVQAQRLIVACEAFERIANSPNANPDSLQAAAWEIEQAANEVEQTILAMDGFQMT